MIDAYVRALERSLRLRPEEIRAVLAEVRGSLEDHAAYLEAGGMDRAAAEEQAIARFGTARGMARALHRAHGRFPLPMRAVIWAVGVLGVGWTVLLALIGPDLLVPVAHMGTRYYTAYAQRLALSFLVAPILLASLSLGAAALGLIGERRGWHGLNVRLWIWLVLAINCLPLLLLGSTVRSIGSATESRPVVPYLPRLAAAGCVYTPGARQPADPVRVDYIVTDSTTTSVAYSIPDTVRTGDLYIRLYDDQGREYSALKHETWYSAAGSAKGLLPWYRGGGGLAVFPALRPGSRVATVRFSAWRGVEAYTGIGSVPASALDLGEVVQVHLDPHVPVVARVAHPRAGVTVHGVSVAATTVVTGPATTHIVYTITSPSNFVAGGFGGYMEAESRGRMVDSTSAYAFHFAGHVGTDVQYTWDEVLAPQPRGSRLVLTVDGMNMMDISGSQLVQTVDGINMLGTLGWLPGRWQLAVTMP